MDTFETDEQRAEAIKKWFKENGRSLITAILFAVIVVLGFKYWRHHQEIVRLEASEHYMALMLSQLQQDEQSAQSKASTLKKEYAKTPYASLAGLHLSKHYVDNDDLDNALSELEWVIEHSTIPEFSLVARTRAARLYVEQENYSQALQVLDVPDADGFVPVIEEIKGDIYLAQGDKDAAIKAYQSALMNLTEKGLEHPLLKMKYQELGGQPLEQEEA